MSRKQNTPLYLNYFVVVLTIAACGIVYQLLLSTASSYILGDSVKQFSIIIGLFMCSMGFGSYISKFIDQKLMQKFILIEILLSIVGGYSVIAVFFLYTHDIFFVACVYLITLIIGTFVGLEIPLIVRVIETSLPLKENLAGVLAFDYLGGLIGSLAFPLVLLPQLGLIKASLLIGMLNLLSLFWLFLKVKDLRQYKILLWVTVAIFSVLLVSFVQGESVERTLEQGMYSDKILLSKKTPYQHIILTQWKKDFRLYINGSLQFSTADEHRYHESLVHIPIALKKTLPVHVLILGGGDGLALREVLKYPSVKTVDLVDIDKAMTTLFTQDPRLTEMNQASLTSPKVSIINDDGFNYVKNTLKRFDYIIADFPDPKNYMIAKLYSLVFYQHIRQALTPEGVFVTQASSPFFTKSVFWCIAKTVGEIFPFTSEYRTDVPSFGQWGFVIASPVQLDMASMMLKINHTKYLTNTIARNSFDFPVDEIIPLSTVKHNTIINPIIVTYYQNELEFLN